MTRLLTYIVLCAAVLWNISAHAVFTLSEEDATTYPQTAKMLPAFIETLEEPMKKMCAFLDNEISALESMGKEVFPKGNPTLSSGAFYTKLLQDCSGKGSAENQGHCQAINKAFSSDPGGQEFLGFYHFIEYMKTTKTCVAAIPDLLYEMSKWFEDNNKLAQIQLEDFCACESFFFRPFC